MSYERDLRNSSRRALRCPVTLRKDDAAYHGETVDISAGGILLRIECPAVIDSCVHYTIELPGDAVGLPTPVNVTCHGRVVRCTPAPNQADQEIAIVTDDYFFDRSGERPLRKTA